MERLEDVIKDIGTRRSRGKAAPEDELGSIPNQPTHTSNLLQTREDAQAGDIIFPTRLPAFTKACPDCNGVGWKRMPAPVGSPNFGRIIPCACKLREIEFPRQRSLAVASNLDSFAGLTFEGFDATVPGVQSAFKAAYATAH